MTHNFVLGPNARAGFFPFPLWLQKMNGLDFFPSFSSSHSKKFSFFLSESQTAEKIEEELFDKHLIELLSSSESKLVSDSLFSALSFKMLLLDLS